MSKGQKLWNEAKKIIPGGNGFFQKDLKCFYLKNGHRIFLHKWM